MTSQSRAQGSAISVPQRRDLGSLGGSINSEHAHIIKEDRRRRARHLLIPKLGSDVHFVVLTGTEWVKL